MKRPLNFYFIILGIILLSSCGSDDGETPASELLAGTTNQGKSYFIDQAEIQLDEIEGTVEIASCITDNTIIYYPSGSYEENEGRTKCDPSDPPGTIATWSLSDDESLLVIDYDSTIVTWNVVSLSGNEHRLSKPASNGTVSYVLKLLN